MEEVVGTIGYTYCLTFQLLESNNLNHKSLLDALRALYIHAMAEVNVVKRMESVNVDKPSYIP
jgi:CMP-2-keto-3-deoxyoctulosonic acid synthetase